MAHPKKGELLRNALSKIPVVNGDGKELEVCTSCQGKGGRCHACHGAGMRLKPVASAALAADEQEQAEKA